jgi:hypothetical protein
MTVLDGVRILDMTRGMAGSAGILLLPQHGADVVKVEPPGDPYRSYPGHRVWNRSRRSVALDLKTHEGRDRFLELVATAGVGRAGAGPVGPAVRAAGLASGTGFPRQPAAGRGHHVSRAGGDPRRPARAT